MPYQPVPPGVFPTFVPPKKPTYSGPPQAQFGPITPAPPIPQFKPPVTSEPAAPTLPYPGYLTPEQILAQATAAVNAANAPALQALAQMKADEQARAQARAELIRGLYAQLAQMQSGAGQATQQIYSTAAANQTAFASGYSDAMKHALKGNASDINATLASIGAPAGQQISNKPARAAGDVLYGLGGVLPSEALNREGAAFGAAAALLPGATFGRGMIDVQQLMNASADTLKQYDQQIQQINMQASVSIQDAVRQLQEQQADLSTEYGKAQQAALDAKWDQADTMTKQTGYVYVVTQAGVVKRATGADGRPIRTLEGEKYDLSVAKAKAAAQPKPVTVKPLTLGQQVAQLNKLGYALNPETGQKELLPGWRINPTTGRAEKIPGTTAAKRRASLQHYRAADGSTMAFDPNTGRRWQISPPGSTKPAPEKPAAKPQPKYTTAQLGAFRKDAADTAKAAFYGFRTDDKFVPPTTYQTALRQMVQAGIPLEIAQQALNRFWTKQAKGRQGGRARIVDGFILMPWEQPGEGRPLVPYQQRAEGKARNASLTGRLVQPLRTRISAGSEFSTPDAEGAPDASGNRYHAAKDYFAPAGSPVVAPQDGMIVEVSASRGNSGQVYGGVVKIQTKDGRVWVFRHIDPARLQTGKPIRAGASIGRVTAWTDGNPHSHIELWKTLGGGYRFENMLDPVPFLTQGSWA